MLTAKRARGAQENSDRKRHRLEGIIPIIEDWHAKMCLVGVNHYYLVYSPLYQINKANVQKKWSHKQITSQKHE